MTEKLADLLSITCRLVLASAICVGAYSHFAFSAPVSDWAVFNSENSDLPDNKVLALALGPDGYLWAGTSSGGLAQLDKDGRWQTYSQANGGLPSDGVQALALGPNGYLWAGTSGGGLTLSRLRL